MSQVPAGWYDDGQGARRYWDGTQWTEHTAPGPSSEGDTAAPDNRTPDVGRTPETNMVGISGQTGHGLTAVAPAGKPQSKRALLIGAGAAVLALAVGGTVFALAGADSDSGNDGFGADPDPTSLISEDCTEADYDVDRGPWSPDCVQARWSIVVHEDGTVVSDQTSYGDAEALMRFAGWDGTGSVADAITAEFGKGVDDVEETLNSPFGMGNVRDYMTADQAAALWDEHGEVRGHVLVSRWVDDGEGSITWSGGGPTERGDEYSLQLRTDGLYLIPAGSLVITVTVPGDVIDTNGTVEGRTVTWTNHYDGAYVSFVSPVGWGALAEDARDSAAKADVSMMGKEIATWFIDHETIPSIEATGTEYYLNGERIGQQTQGVNFGGVTGTGARDWCVWVYAPEGDTTRDGVSYTAQAGLQPGNRCGQ